MDFIHTADGVCLKNEDGDIIAQVSFTPAEKDVVEIDYTFVDESLRGQNIANGLLLSLAQRLQAEKKKAIPVCSYAVKWFKANKEYGDILKKYI